MSDTQELTAADGEVVWLVNGQRRSFNLTALNGLEFRAAKLVTGMSQPDLMAGCIDASDFEAMAALIWVYETRVDPDVAPTDIEALDASGMAGYLAVLAQLSYDSLGLKVEPLDNDS